MVCPRLQWARPTLANLKGQVEMYAPIHREMRMKADATMTAQRAVVVEEEWKATTLRKLRNKMKNKPVAEDARTRYNNILTPGILDLRSERELAASHGRERTGKFFPKLSGSLRFVHRSQQFSFLEFAMIQPQGPELFSVGRIQELAQGPSVLPSPSHSLPYPRDLQAIKRQAASRAQR